MLVLRFWALLLVLPSCLYRNEWFIDRRVLVSWPPVPMKKAKLMLGGGTQHVLHHAHSFFQRLAYHRPNLIPKAWCEDIDYLVFDSLLLYKTAYYLRVWYSRNATGEPAESYCAIVAELRCHHTSVITLLSIDPFIEVVAGYRSCKWLVWLESSQH